MKPQFTLGAVLAESPPGRFTCSYFEACFLLLGCSIGDEKRPGKSRAKRGEETS
jgi:hypothetical protein